MPLLPLASTSNATLPCPLWGRDLHIHYTLVQKTWPLQIHTHARLTALCPGLPGWSGTRKVKPIRILLKQESVGGSGISWAVCKSARRSRQSDIASVILSSVSWINSKWSSFITCWEFFISKCHNTQTHTDIFYYFITYDCLQTNQLHYRVCGLLWMAAVELT